MSVFCATRDCMRLAALQGETRRRAKHLSSGVRWTHTLVDQLFFINLDRRSERCERFLNQTRRLGIRAERFPAVDGQQMDLQKFPRGAVTESAIKSALNPPGIVNGVHLTCGALGLILSYRTLLRRIAADRDNLHVYVIAEDDVTFCEDFNLRMREVLATLEREDSEWEFLHLGYYADDCILRALESDARRVLCKPVQVYGLFGAAIRPRGARRLLKSLFPLEEQIDSSLAKVYDQMRAFAVRKPLLNAQHSTHETSDIQILPKGFSFN